MTDVFDPARLDAIRNRVEPTPDARDAARKIIYEWTDGLPPEKADQVEAIASAIARATAASEARGRELEEGAVKLVHDGIISMGRAAEVFKLPYEDQLAANKRIMDRALGGAR